MKIIHCADIHLGSSLTSYISKEKAEIRKGELLSSFVNMVSYASENNVDSIIIAGDLFDKDAGIRKIKDTVYSIIRNHDGIQFFYLKGNHDMSDSNDEIPKNMHIFSNNWSYYALSDSVCLAGIEIDEKVSSSFYKTLDLDSNNINIVTMHGQISNYEKKDGDIINLRELKNRNIDYLALGHIHSYISESLDGRGVYVYPGCLEGRGFDEVGSHGFVLIDIDEEKKTLDYQFVKSSLRTIYNEDVDISNCKNSYEILEMINQNIALKKYSVDDIVYINLIGNVDVEVDINIEFLNSQLESLFFYLRIKNNTKLCINYDDYTLEESLKGEFVRTVYSCSDLSDEEKAEIIKYGISSLSGEVL